MTVQSAEDITVNHTSSEATYPDSRCQHKSLRCPWHACCYLATEKRAHSGQVRQGDPMTSSAIDTVNLIIFFALGFSTIKFLFTHG